MSITRGVAAQSSIAATPGHSLYIYALYKQRAAQHWCTKERTGEGSSWTFSISLVPVSKSCQLLVSAPAASWAARLLITTVRFSDNIYYTPSVLVIVAVHI